MKKLYSILFITALFLLISCGDDDKKPDTGNGGGAHGYTHNQLAERFVQKLNLDEDFNVTLAKNSTHQTDYIVIHDPLTDSYDAINIESYDPERHNASDYYYDNAGSFYYDLDMTEGYWGYLYEEGDGYVNQTRHFFPPRFYDRGSDLIFEKIEATPKDLAKISALKEAVAIEKRSNFLSSELGLSLSRSKEIARLAEHWNKSSLKGMTDQEHDQFSTELLGFSISEAKSAVKESLSGNNDESIKGLVNKAASQNGITPEHAQKLLTKVFGL